MSNGFIYVVDAHFIDKIGEKKILNPSACEKKRGNGNGYKTILCVARSVTDMVRKGKRKQVLSRYNKTRINI